MADDSWDNATTGLYGVTRAHRPYRRYLWLALILAVTALVPTVGVPLLLPDDIGGRDPGPIAGGGPARPTTAGPSADGTPAVAVVLTAPPSTGTAPRGEGPWSAGAVPPATGPGAPASTPVTLPLEIEAEAPAVRLRRAIVEAVDGASGGNAVRFTAANGEVRVDWLSVPTGSYRITIVYAPGGAWAGLVRGFDGPVGVSFDAGAGCCATVTAQTTLTTSGSLHIGLSNGDAGSGYPAIDRIVIEPA